MKEKPFIIYAGFLPEEINRSLLNYAVSTSGKFHNSTITSAVSEVKDAGDDPSAQNWRRSRHVYQNDFEEYYSIVREKILAMYRGVCDQLHIAPFEIESVEMQMTSHNDGDFYKPHADKSNNSHINRVITFVYYFHSIPKEFSGGQLLFFQPTPSVVEPDNNTIVFFDSSLQHAVHPVSCPSKKFEHSRFTLNGWIRK